jgi:hypothetical protein
MELVYGEMSRTCSMHEKITAKQFVNGTTMQRVHLRNLANDSITFKWMFMK